MRGMTEVWCHIGAPSCLAMLGMCGGGRRRRGRPQDLVSPSLNEHQQQREGQISPEKDASNSVPSAAGGQERDIESCHSRTSQAECKHSKIAARAQTQIQNPDLDEKAAESPNVHAANSPNRNVSRIVEPDIASLALVHVWTEPAIDCLSFPVQRLWIALRHRIIAQTLRFINIRVLVDIDLRA